MTPDLPHRSRIPLTARAFRRVTCRAPASPSDRVCSSPQEQFALIVPCLEQPLASHAPSQLVVYPLIIKLHLIETGPSWWMRPPQGRQAPSPAMGSALGMPQHTENVWVVQSSGNLLSLHGSIWEPCCVLLSDTASELEPLLQGVVSPSR